MGLIRGCQLHDEALHHRRRYTRRRLLKKIGKHDWKVVQCSYFNTALVMPILALRKAKALLWKTNGAPQSDLFMSLPGWLNRMLSVLFTAEIRCLRFFDFPFGVSLVLLLRK